MQTDYLEPLRSFDIIYRHSERYYSRNFVSFYGKPVIHLLHSALHAADFLIKHIFEVQNIFLEMLCDQRWPKRPFPMEFMLFYIGFVLKTRFSKIVRIKIK